MEDNISDQEMDFDFIHKPTLPLRKQIRPIRPKVQSMDGLSNSNDHFCPSTPPNVFANISSPLSTSNFAMEEEESFFIRKVGTNKSFINRLKFTSTPVPASANLSKTLPLDFANTSVRIGTDQIPIQYLNPFTPDGKALTSKSSTSKSLQR